MTRPSAGEESDLPAQGTREGAGFARGRLVLVVAVLLAGVVAWTILRGARAHPNVLLVTIDTLRADAAGREHGTPAIAEFLAKATHFRRARTTVPLTAPAHGSLLTGLEPRHTGCHDNIYSALPRERTFRLLAEDFAGEGYATAAFLSSVILEARTGLAGGFAVYDCPEATSGEGRLAGRGERSAEETLRLALPWLGKRPPDQPFFLWVHFNDPHDPYLSWEGDARRAGTGDGDTEAQRYAGEVRRVDAAIERLLASVPPETLVVICSDHGESLGEHGEQTHGVLCFSSTSDVFLAAKGPGLRPGAVDETPRSLCDVAPTLRSWCGLPERASDGSPLFGSATRPVVTESLYHWRMHGWGQCFSVSDGASSLVESGASLELYDLRRDPGEANPRELRADPAFPSLDRRLQEYRATPPPSAEPVLEAGPETPYGTLRRPASSYLPRRENARLADPRTKLALATRLAQAREAAIGSFESGDVTALRRWAELFESMAREDDVSAVAFEDLVRIYGALGEFTGDKSCHGRAAAAAREVITRGFPTPKVVLSLCQESLRSGAIEDLRATLDILGEARPPLDPASERMLRRVVAELEERGERELAERGRALLARLRG